MALYFALHKDKLAGACLSCRTTFEVGPMNYLLGEAIVQNRYALRLYFAPFTGAVRGTVREIARVRREMNRERERLLVRRTSEID